jgi:hypothetical protein
MKDISLLTVKRWVWPGLVLCMWILFTGFSGCGREDVTETVRFDVGEGLAVETLKEAAGQAKVEFIFSSQLVQDLRTRAINGKYAPSGAFEMMLADSFFIVVQHEQSGVYSIQKSSDR